MAANLHIINKQVYEFDCLNEEHAFQMQHKADRLLMERISKSIERICDQMSDDNENLQIQLLEIDLGEIAFDHFEERMLTEFEKAFFEKLLEWKTKHTMMSVPPVSKKESAFRILNFFLRKGRLPWFAGRPGKIQVTELLAEIFAGDPEELKRFILLNLDDEKFIQRLIREIDEEELDRIITLLDLDSAIVVKIEEEIIQLLQAMLSLDLTQNRYSGEEENRRMEIEKGISHFKKLTDLLKKILEDRSEVVENSVHRLAIELSFKLVSGKNEFSDARQLFIFLDSMIADKFNIGHAILEPASAKVKHEETLFDIVAGETEKINNSKKLFVNEVVDDDEADDNLKFYISNAGLVLAANYFPAFFKEFQLLEDGRFISSHQQNKAVFLLHYLCTGEETSPEYTLSLNKILCGMPLDEPLAFSGPFTEKEKSECNELLSEIIDNWQKLGNSSIDGLRESFLNRDGILSFENNSWKLTIERKGYDVLLDSIPWSFKHIKLNWMDSLIVTEW